MRRALALALLLTACDDTPATSDGPVDAARDEARTDLAARDGAMPDLGAPDLGAPDLAAADQEVPDLAAADLDLPDLAEPDLAEPDLAEPDLASTDEATVDLKPACDDGERNGGETDVDCGGPCPACTLGRRCAVDSDCSSKGCCAERCVERASDPANCGACGTACSGLPCVAGKCQASDLVAHYRFDEGAGGVAVDSSGNGHTGAHDAAYAGGKRGTALYFNGSTSVKAAAAPTLTWGAMNADFTVEYWIQVTGATTGNFRCVLHHGSSDAERTSGHWLDASSLRINAAVSTASNGNDFLPTPVLPLNQWVHVAAVKKGDTQTLFVDGEPAGSKVVDATVGNAGPLYLGKDPWWPGMQGLLDEVRVYRRALTQSEIQADMK